MNLDGIVLTEQEQTWVDSKYKLVFPSLVFPYIKNKDIRTQKLGVDLIFKFRDDRKFYMIEEKVRTRYYGDLLLEDWSVYEKRTPGWTRDKHKTTDYLAYYYPRQRIFWIMHFPALRDWFYENYDTVLAEIKRQDIKRFNSEYVWGKTKESGYHTANIPVPLSVFGCDWINKHFRIV